MQARILARALQAGSRCSTSSCSRRSPWYSLMSSRYTRRTRPAGSAPRRARVDAVEGDGVEAAARPRGAATSSFRCRSPTTRAFCDRRTRRRTAARESLRPRARRRAAPAAVAQRDLGARRARRRSRCIVRRPTRASQRATSASKARAKRSRCARSASGPRPSHGRRTCSISSGCARGDAHRARRGCARPATERAEPRSMPPRPPARRRSTGRRSCSLTRLATRPTTPWCQLGIEQAHAARRLLAASRLAQRAHRGQRLRLHARLDLAALARSAASSSRGQRCAPRRRRRRAGSGCRCDMSSRRPAAFSRGATAKPRSPAISVARLALADLAAARGCPARSARRGCARRPCATSTRLLASSGTTSATVPSATRSSQCATGGAPARHAPRCLEQRAAAPPAHRRPRRRRPARGCRSWLPGRFGIHDDVGVRQLGAGQVMIGDQHVDAARARRRHAGEAGDAVVDGDDQRRARAAAASATISGVSP